MNKIAAVATVVVVVLTAWASIRLIHAIYRKRLREAYGDPAGIRGMFALVRLYFARARLGMWDARDEDAMLEFVDEMRQRRQLAEAKKAATFLVQTVRGPRVAEARGILARAEQERDGIFGAIVELAQIVRQQVRTGLWFTHWLATVLPFTVLLPALGTYVVAAQVLK